MDQLPGSASINLVDAVAAADYIGKASRVVIFGCSGSGKSTLAQALAEKLGLRYVSMDRDIFWLPGWQMRGRSEALQRMRDFAAGDRWIFDGNSPGSLAIRLERADLVIWCRPPRWISVSGVLRRWLRYKGQSRPEMAPGCPEKIDWKFLKYIWSFEREETPQFIEALARHGRNIPVVMLGSYRENRVLVASIPAGLDASGGF